MSIRLVLAIASLGLLARTAAAQDLATRLATPDLREAAVKEVAAVGDRELPTLLTWTKTPPAAMDKRELGELQIGLADAFRTLKAKEAIPFLVSHIGLERYYARRPFWLKPDPIIQDRLPAAAALIAIGADASTALLAVDWTKLSPDEFEAAIYTISRIADPDARDFLMSVHVQAEEAEFVKEGLRAIAAKSAPAHPASPKSPD